MVGAINYFLMFYKATNLFLYGCKQKKLYLAVSFNMCMVRVYWDIYHEVTISVPKDDAVSSLIERKCHSIATVTLFFSEAI